MHQVQQVPAWLLQTAPREVKRVATKGEDKVGTPSQGSQNEGELAGEEVVEPKSQHKRRGGH
jgi:hypothetical protein